MRTTIGILIITCALACAVASPAQSPPIPTTGDTAMATEIEHRLSTDRDVNAQMIKIDVRGGVVTLSGSVPGEDAKDKAGKLAAGVPGVVDVHNQIAVGNPKAPGDPPGTIPEKMPGDR
jgi:osmotically-inducible protein OsmY